MHIIALVAAALIPAFAVGATAVSAALTSYRRSFEDRLHNIAAALASAVGSEIERHTVAVTALSTSSNLDRETLDLAVSHERARWMAGDLGSRIFLIQADGTMLLHSDFPFGTGTQARRQGQQTSDVARQVFESRRSAGGDGIPGQMSGLS